MTPTQQLLSGIDGLKRPNYHILDERQRLLHACLCAYAKHHLDNQEIGWDELGNILYHAIVNEIGDKQFQLWLDRIK